MTISGTNYQLPGIEITTATMDVQRINGILMAVRAQALQIKNPPRESGVGFRISQSLQKLAEQRGDRLGLVARDGERTADVVADAGVDFRSRVDAHRLVDGGEHVVDAHLVV